MSQRDLSMDVSDAGIVRAVRSGRRDAYDELVRRYAAKIRAICWSKLGRRGPVDDMVQEAFLRAYRAIATLTEPEKFGSWLYGIAVRACLDWLKAKERSQVTFSALGPDVRPDDLPGGQPRPLPEENDRHRKVLDEVQSLPEIYREVVMMFYYRKQPYVEMSAMLGISPAAINARLSKARAMLRERLARAV
jgi:RNA polymerase sigma-70 factor (ECF subfamily)